MAAGAADLLGKSKEVTCFDEVFDIPWSRSPIRFGNLAAAKKVRNLVFQGKFDLVHVHTPIASFVTRAALRRRPSAVRVLYTAHGFHFGFDDRSPYLNPYFYAERLAAEWTDGLIVINERDHSTAKKLNLITNDRLYYTPGIGVDLSKYSVGNRRSSVRSARRSELGIGSENFLLLMIAEFNPGKRHSDLLAAISKLDEKVHVAFAGDGSLMSKIKEQVSSRSLAHRVHFLGFRTDIPDWISACDACVLPSEREGLPRSVLEAMAMERFVIGSRIRGIEELLGDGCGLLFSVGDTNALRNAILTAATDAELRERTIRNARIKVERYSLDTVIRMHDEIYFDQLERRGA